MEIEDHKSDMTPMIDVVFQLIIFFVLVIDLTQQSFESLKLPVAKYAIPDENPPDIRPIVNIMQNGTMMYNRNTYYDPNDEENFTNLRNLLSLFANEMMRESKKPLSPGNPLMIPYDPLLIRADMWTDFFYVAKLMEQCGQKGIMIWKLELALAEPEGYERKNK